MSTETQPLPRPAPSEHEAYYGRYIALVPDGDIVATLAAQMRDTRTLLASVPPERETYRYRPEKWSVREVVGHLLDSERTFAFRALSMARADPAPLPSLDQEHWGRTSNAGGRPLPELAEEWEATRASHVLMFRSFDADMGARRGVASGFEFTVRCFPWIIAGHELYHRRLLRRDYLGDGG